MKDDDFKVEGLDRFHKKLLEKATKELPRETFKMLRTMGNELRKMARADGKKRVPKVTGNYHKGWKRGKAYKKTSSDFQIRVGNNSRHAHLVEKGSRIVDKNGDEHGFAEGTPVLADALKKFNSNMKKYIEEWLDNLVGDMKL